jgi:hypothetical protein
MRTITYDASATIIVGKVHGAMATRTVIGGTTTTTMTHFMKGCQTRVVGGTPTVINGIAVTTGGTTETINRGSMVYEPSPIVLSGRATERETPFPVITMGAEVTGSLRKTAEHVKCHLLHRGIGNNRVILIKGDGIGNREHTCRKGIKVVSQKMDRGTLKVINKPDRANNCQARAAVRDYVNAGGTMVTGSFKENFGPPGGTFPVTFDQKVPFVEHWGRTVMPNPPLDAKNCDEFPFAKSREGGGWSVPGGWEHSERCVSDIETRLQGDLNEYFLKFMPIGEAFVVEVQNVADNVDCSDVLFVDEPIAVPTHDPIVPGGVAIGRFSWQPAPPQPGPAPGP